MLLATPKDTLDVATKLSQRLSAKDIVYLIGDLGAGKTTFMRGILQGLGYQGKVKSPTYSLVELYNLQPPVYHFDLYRLSCPSELEYIGIRDYLTESICCFEWPEKAQGAIPKATITVTFEITSSGRVVNIA